MHQGYNTQQTLNMGQSWAKQIKVQQKKLLQRE